MEKKVMEKLNDMVHKGVIIQETEPTEWVSQMVATKKKNGDVRICLDPRDLNKALQRPHYPMRSADDVASRIGKAKVFSTLDAKAGFWQIRMDEESSRRTTFSTPYGRYRFLRMPFGINTASEVFQQVMERLFEGYPCAIVIDDILIWGANDEEHNANLKKILERARQIGLKLNPNKWKFKTNTVSFVGHLFTEDGLKADPEKTRAICDMPKPADQAALQRFLGMTNYLSKFIPNYSEKTAILRELLRTDTTWDWTEMHQKAFERLKETLSNPPVLTFFDPQEPVILSVDSSKSGLGAACLQRDLPVAFASRALSDAETRYAQIEKELLAAVFACKKFNDFVYGRKVTIETDHKPLINITKKPLSAAPARLQRMLLQLQRYNLEFVYKKGKELFIADTLSRAYPDGPAEETEFDLEVMSVLSISPARLSELQIQTAADVTLQKLAKFIKSGWPSHESSVPPDVKDYFPFRDELVVDNGVIMKGQRALIPRSLQSTYIAIFHKGHMGAHRTKELACDISFWPRMRKDIESAVSQCSACNSCKAHLQKQPLHCHDIPELPWESLGADIFDWNSKQYLVVVDSYSGWFEMDALSDSSSRSIITKMKRLFATHGIPKQLMTDNGRQFVSKEFEDFAEEWNFVRITSSPHYPRSNGLAENAVKQAKQLLEKSRMDGSDVFLGLLNLRNTPRGDMGSPAQRLFSRRTRTTLPTSTKLLKPKASNHKKVPKQLLHARQVQKRHHDKSARDLRLLRPNEIVRMQTDKGFQRLAVVISARNAPRSYVVMADGTSYVRNRRHLLPVHEPRPADSHSQPHNVNPSSPNHSLPVDRPTAAVKAGQATPPHPLDHQHFPQPCTYSPPTTRSTATLKQQPQVSMPCADNQTQTPYSPTSSKLVTHCSPQTPVAKHSHAFRESATDMESHEAARVKNIPTSSEQTQPMVTRFGRTVKPNPKYFDF